MTTEARGRAAVAERSQGRCEACGLQRSDGVHHRQPRSAGGTWSPANLLALCGSGTTGCHGRVEDHRDPITGTGRDDLDAPVTTYQLGLHVRRGQDPYDVPVRLRHPVYGAGWWRLHDDGGMDLVASWSPPRRAEQLPTHKTDPRVRR